MDGYLFTDNPNDANIGSDTGRKEMDATIARSPYPYATVELGSGIQVTKIRRPVITGEDCGAMALCKIGSGVAMLGYYVFHGGINPTGAFTSMQEYRDEKNLRAGFCCDLPEFNYDFQAPIGQYGEIRPSGRELKLWNYLIRGFGREICTLPVRLMPGNPSDPADLQSLRCAVRGQEEGGFVFFNNYVRHYPTKEHRLHAFSPANGVTFPDFTLKSGQYCAFVFNREICGTRFRYALATPFCTLNEKDCVFWAEEGQGAIETEGDPAGKVILLSKQDAQNAWCFSYAGMDRLFVTDGEMYIRGRNCAFMRQKCPPENLSEARNAAVRICLHGRRRCVWFVRKKYRRTVVFCANLRTRIGGRIYGLCSEMRRPVRGRSCGVSCDRV